MISNIIENHLIPKKDYVYGFADLHGLLPKIFSKYNYGISIGRRLDSRIIDNLTDGPTLEYFKHYNETNKILRKLTLKIAYDLGCHNISSLPIEPTISLGSKQNENYLKSLTYDISHKMVATKAGLGWIGKTDLLITKEFGPRLRLVSILLKDDPGCSAKPVEKSKCGKCNLCVIYCPAEAANGLPWNVDRHRDSFFNAYKCREKCAELAKQKLNVEERICGLCIGVCPIGKTKME